MPRLPAGRFLAVASRPTPARVDPLRRDDRGGAVDTVERPMREPSSARRQAAANLHELFVALLEAGFSENQAITIVCRKIPTVRP